MAHALAVICPPDVVVRDAAGEIVSMTEHQDKVMSEHIATDLGRSGFCTEVNPTAQNAFHFLFANDTEEYFALCRHYNQRVRAYDEICIPNNNSALSEEEINRLTPYLQKLDNQEKIGEFNERGADIYVVSARYKDKLFLSAPVVRNCLPTDFHGEKDNLVETWSYKLLEGSVELIAAIDTQSFTLAKELEITKPLIFGFSLDDSGNPVLVQIMPNFGLCGVSILPTVLELNGIRLRDFLTSVYKIV